MSAPPELDDIDFAIMDVLRRDGRTPTLELARVIGAPEATVRKRLKRLLEHDYIKIVAVTSTRALGYRREVSFAIKTRPGRAIEVARSLAERDAVRFVSFGLGAFDLWVNAIFKTDADLLAFVTDHLALEGIASYETMDVMAVFKRSFDWLVDRELTDGAHAPTTEHGNRQR